MKIVHVHDEVSEEVLDVYFVDEETNKRVDYSIEEFKKSIKQ